MTYTSKGWQYLSAGVLVSLFSTHGLLLAEELVTDPEQQSWVEGVLDKLGADGGFDDSKTIDFSVLPGPFYNPDLQFGIGVSAAGLYRIGDSDEDKISSLTINGFASTNASFGVIIDNKTLLDEDRKRFFLRTEMNSMTEVFYGAGYGANSRDENKTRFTLEEFTLQPKFMGMVANNFYVGAGVDFSLHRAKSIRSEFEPDYSPEDVLEDARSVGVSGHLVYDNRDIMNNPYSGVLFQVDAGIYRKAMGSENNFDIYDMNYSQYLSLATLPGVLAWQVKARFSDGDVPWSMLARLGGGANLRGYLSGRYRGENLLLTQVEYRMPLAGRHGMVFWTGAGTVANKASELSTSDLLPNVGVGYRFEIKQRTNLRLDYGIGKNDSGFYFNVNEAF